MTTRMKVKTFLVLLAAAIAVALGASGNAAASATTNCTPPEWVSNPSINAANGNVGTSGSGFAGTVDTEGLCSTTYTVTWYRVSTPTSQTGSVAQTNTVTCATTCTAAQKTFTHTAVAGDVGYYLRIRTVAQVPMFNTTAWSNAWGPITGTPPPPPPPPATRTLTYNVTQGGISRGNYTIKRPIELRGMVEAQPRDGYCTKFDADFFNFNFQRDSDRVWTGMTDAATWMNGGEDGDFNTNDPYPSASITTGGDQTRNWRALSWPTAWASCPHQQFPGIGEWATTYPNLDGPLARAYTGEIRVNGISIHGPHPEVTLVQYWLMGNQNCPTFAGTCDWIESGFAVGNYSVCGLNLNDGQLHYYVEYLHNRTPTSFQNQICVNDGANGSVVHWRDCPDYPTCNPAAATQQFYIFGTVPYGTTKLFDLNYVSG